MNNDPSLLPASALAYTPREVLTKKTVENAAVIGHLEALLRAEKCELVRLLAQQSTFKRSRPTPSTPKYPTIVSSTYPDCSTGSSSLTAGHISPQITKPSFQGLSPRGVMHSFSDPNTPSTTSSGATSTGTSSDTNNRGQARREMAARGSHWSFIEKARFEAALLKYGPFAWDEIIKAVGTRTEKQVKAYAARYRRRKKLAARMQALPIMTYPYPMGQQSSVPGMAHYPAMDQKVPGPTMFPTHFEGRITKRQKIAPTISQAKLAPAAKSSTVRGSQFPNTAVPKSTEQSVKCGKDSTNANLLSDLPPSLDILGQLSPEAALEVPNDMEMLVDEVIGEMDCKQDEEPLVVQHDDDSSAQDLINSWLN